MRTELLEELKNDLVRIGILIRDIREGKRTINKSYNAVIKEYVEKEKYLLQAISTNDETDLVERFGEFYRAELKEIRKVP